MAANLLIYYQEGDKQVRVAPDVFVVVGASSQERSSYLLWQEPKAPDWVLEITRAARSKSSVASSILGDLLAPVADPENGRPRSVTGCRGRAAPLRLRQNQGRGGAAQDITP